MAAAALIVLGVWALNSQGTSPQEAPKETTTTQDSGEVTLDLENLELEEELVVVTPEPTAPSQVNAKPAVSEPIDLGPRQKAVFPGDALRYFAEANKAGDTERALSYFIADQQDQYRKVLEEEYAGRQHPVTLAYYNGRVEDAVLWQSKYGIYVIDVYPSDSELPRHTYYIFDAEAGEFVITEI